MCNMLKAIFNYYSVLVNKVDYITYSGYCHKFNIIFKLFLIKP